MSKICKKLIQHRFNVASNSYDQVAQIQKSSANTLISELCKVHSDFDPRLILDLGTGTGYVFEALSSVYKNASYILNDIAPNMLQIVEEKLKKYDNINVDFYVGDMEHGDFQSCDLVVSNFALQWVHNLELVINKFYTQSKIFAFSCLLEGTFKEWYDIIKSYTPSRYIKEYPSHAQELIDIFTKVNCNDFHVAVKEFTVHFQDANTMIQYLKKLGASASSVAISVPDLRKLITEYKKEFSITYRIFFGIMKRA